MTMTHDLSGTILVLGGAALVKALSLKACSGLWQRRPYLATAEALDIEMTTRIERHQSRRGNKWTTLEEPVDISAAITRTRDPLLVDCLTIWLSNLIHLEKTEMETADLCQGLQDHDQPVVLVSNEVGGGIVPENKLARRFRDEAGLLNQRVASVADSVYLVTAGLPQNKQPNGTHINAVKSSIFR